MRFTAKRAIILAAGRGERLRPLTDSSPKPLLVYDSVPIIERIIARVHEAGITEIVVVTGYKAASFAYLPGKFAGVELRFNERWADGNNVLSVGEVIELTGDALIINGDAIITDQVLVREYEGTTMYADRSVGFSREWELVLDKDGLVSSLNLAGGADILQQREVTFVCHRDFPVFKDRVLERIAQGRLGDFFEFCLFPSLKVHALQVPFRSVFDLDSYEEWNSDLLADKRAV